jgi:hypothetical protein
MQKIDTQFDADDFVDIYEETMDIGGDVEVTFKLSTGKPEYAVVTSRIPVHHEGSEQDVFYIEPDTVVRAAAPKGDMFDAFIPGLGWKRLSKHHYMQSMRHLNPDDPQYPQPFDSTYYASLPTEPFTGILREDLDMYDYAGNAQTVPKGTEVLINYCNPNEGVESPLPDKFDRLPYSKYGHFSVSSLGFGTSVVAPHNFHRSLDCRDLDSDFEMIITAARQEFEIPF